MQAEYGEKGAVTDLGEFIGDLLDGADESRHAWPSPAP
jgi:hypothetical protein